MVFAAPGAPPLPATLWVEAGSVHAQASDGSNHAVDLASASLEYGGASQSVLFVRDRARGLTLCTEDPKLVHAIRSSAPASLAPQLEADGETPMGAAIERAIEMVSQRKKAYRANGIGYYRPWIFMISDGEPTDDFNTGLNKLMANPWARKAVRIGIGIDEDADLDVIRKFIAHPEIEPLRADNAPTLARYIKWASTAVVKSASAPASHIAGNTPQGAMNVPIPTPPIPVPSTEVGPNDVW